MLKGRIEFAKTGQSENYILPDPTPDPRPPTPDPYASWAERTSVAFVPPNPKEFEMAWRIFFSRA